ncbi:hypothetical protein GCM10009851_26760 [Herbiconiux moechotypicola]|uniref:DUF11 domain-containing protein n=1 Tax=Herbiconiux moechotypicola TaxID=637393 RepID=A0ABN3DRS9_9MICO
MIGAAWAAPVVVVAATAPAATASPEPALLGLRAVGPTEYTPSGSTTYAIYLTNTGDQALASGAITGALPSGAGWTWYAYAGNAAWSSSGSGGTRTFSYNAALDPGSETGVLYVLISSTDRSQSPTPVATVTFTAPGFGSTAVPMQIVY